MAAVFNIIEIFEIADQIEKAGAGFYRKAAEYVSGDEKELLLKLAELEDSHKSYFETLKEVYGINKVEDLVDQHSEASKYLKWIAEGHVVHHLERFFEQDQLSVVAVLNKAIEFEKDTVVYFTALKAALTDEDERAKVEMLIHEESYHVGMLSKKLREIENN